MLPAPCYSPSAIRYSPSAIRYSPFAIRPLLLAIRHSLFAISYALLALSYSPFAIRHSPFAIRYALFAPCSVLFPRVADPEKRRVDNDTKGSHPLFPSDKCDFSEKENVKYHARPSSPCSTVNKRFDPFPGVGKSGDDGQLANVHNFP